MKSLISRYPILRGMLSYSVIWPSGNLLQQIFITKEETIHYDRCFRFCVWGAFVVAPSLYAWVRISSFLFPTPGLKWALCKAALETVSYTPLAMVSFYFGMSLFEGKSVTEAVDEVRQKFLPTYQTGAVVWPVVAFVNFGFIPERNRVVFISCCSLAWTTFLAFMKQKSVNVVSTSEAK